MKEELRNLNTIDSIDKATKNKKILDDRAIRLAQVPKKNDNFDNTIEITTFFLGSEKFGIESCFVKEVVRAPELTPIPLVPKFILGLVNLRGEILVIIDLLSFFGVDRDIKGYSSILVLGERHVEFGLAAQKADDVRKIMPESLQDPPESLSEIAKELILGILDTEITILNGQKLFQDQRLFIGEKS